MSLVRSHTLLKLSQPQRSETELSPGNRNIIVSNATLSFQLKNRTLTFLPRTARRSRKPLQETRIKGHPKGIKIKCGYNHCSYEWDYFGGRRWAECPVCHSTTRVASGRRMQ